MSEVETRIKYPSNPDGSCTMLITTINHQWDGYMKTIWIFLCNSTIIASCESTDWGDKFMLHSLYVIDQYRKDGIGLQLVTLCEKEAIKRKYKYCYLFVAKDSWMQKWYEKLGYVAYGEKDEKNNWMKKIIL